MGIMDGLFKKMKMNPEDEDDYEDEEEESYDDYEEDDEIISKKPQKKSIFSKRSQPVEEDEEEEEEEPEEEKAPQPSAYKPSQSYGEKKNIVGMRSMKNGSSEVCMILPKNFDDANTIADVLLSHRAVVLNLEGIDMTAAQRIVDFASGACYTVGGSLQKISKKIFMIVPQDMNLSGDFDEKVGDMVDLNSVNMMK